MSDQTEKNDVPTWLPYLCVVAIIAAAAPNYFFTTPFRLHIDGLSKGFYGLSIWGPSILAAAAFFSGVDYFDRLRPKQKSLDAMTIIAPLLWFVFVATWFPGYWTNITTPPWDVLIKVMPLYAGLFAIQVLFFQGLLQQKILGHRHRYLRAFVPGLVAAAIWLPCVRHMVDMETSFYEFLLPAFVHQSILSGMTESGATNLRVMIVAAIMGAAWVWFQQGIF